VCKLGVSGDRQVRAQIMRYALTITERSLRESRTGEYAVIAHRSAKYRQGVKSVVAVDVFTVLVEQFVLGRIFRVVLIVRIGKTIVRLVLEFVFFQSVTKIGVFVPHNQILSGSYTMAAFPGISQ
jgi:hypothetical protein